MKLDMKEYSGSLKFQSVLFEMKLGAKRYLVVLISRSIIVLWGNCGSKTLKFYVLNETQYSEIFKSENSGFSFSIRLFF